MLPCLYTELGRHYVSLQCCLVCSLYPLIQLIPSKQTYLVQSYAFMSIRNETLSTRRIILSYGYVIVTFFKVILICSFAVIFYLST